ncbi:MAG: hypothetical protein AB9907_05630 [Flexilinea sp.]
MLKINQYFPQLKRKIFFGMIVLLILVCFGNVSAADYSFAVPKDLVIFAIDSDGKASVSYEFTIENYGKGLDYIDIALPSNNFDLTGVQATIDGTPVDSGNLSRVDYNETGLLYGVTIDNTRNPIPSGQSADIYIEILQIRDLLYKVTDSSKSEDYVSFQYQPSYFSSDFTRGKTDFTIRLVLPTGLTSEEPVYFTPESWVGNSEPDSWINDSGNVVYEWNSPNADSSSAYTFGAMFPQRILTSLDQVSDPGSYSNPNAASSDWSFSDSAITAGICLIPILIVFFSIYAAIKRAKKFKGLANSYLPPSIKAEGEGIKRGLTAVEAAVLLEEKMDKIISMIIFSLSKKGAIAVTSQNPLVIKAEDPLPDKLLDYESGFIEAMSESADKEQKAKMTKTISDLILSVTEKMKGYSLEDTKTYYRSIIEKAWQQVQAADSPELKGEKLDEIFGWAVLDEDVEGKTKEVFGNTPVFLPMWWWRMGPIYSTTPSTVSAGTGGNPVSTMPSTSTTSTPTLPGSDFARSITDSVRNFGVGTVGSIKGFTNKVTGQTNPLSAPSGGSNRSNWSGRGGGGGRSCACACACAGCACAGGGGGGGR